MANPAHLAKLKEGVEAWNDWRAEHSSVEPDLSGADLEDVRLESVLTPDEFSRAELSHVDFREANLTSARLLHADLTGARLTKANLPRAQLTGATLNGADLRGADLSLADLIQATMVETNLSDANLFWANLGESTLLAANLSGAFLGRAYLRGACLDEANLAHCKMHGTVLGQQDLSKVYGLASVQHSGPSSIDIATICRSMGQIPDSFLRGCGVPEEFITFTKSLVTNPIEFYSCFISYSTKNNDNDFASELHAKLQEKGVRCWFAPEDLKIGDKFQERIEESIRLYDKLLVVLSEKSVESPWVEREVQAAFEKERKQGSTVLFPVRLDDAVMDCQRAWAADIRRTRHIGDFRKWKDHDSFQKSLDRLLRDLKSQDAKLK
jgi:uncharacterized protein YjbI with pentapeptide repeats